MATTIGSANYDAKKFKVCCPWNNKRGASWTLTFKIAFEDGCRSHIDNFASCHQTLVTETDFGGANGPAHPGGPGAGINVQSNAARSTRVDAIYGAILLHACQIQGNNERVKAHVATMVGAPSLAAIGAANAAIAAANAANVVAAAAGQPLIAVPAAAVDSKDLLE